MEVRIPKQVRLRGDDGTEVTVDISDVTMDADQTEIMKKVLGNGNHAGISPDEWEKIKDLKSIIKRPGGESDLIVRFDWKWVRIDEPGRRFEDLINPGNT